MLYGRLSYAQSRCADGWDMYNVYFEMDVKYLPAGVYRVNWIGEGEQLMGEMKVVVQ